MRDELSTSLTAELFGTQPMNEAVLDLEIEQLESRIAFNGGPLADDDGGGGGGGGGSSCSCSCSPTWN